MLVINNENKLKYALVEDQWLDINVTDNPKNFQKVFVNQNHWNWEPYHERYKVSWI